MDHPPALRLKFQNLHRLVYSPHLHFLHGGTCSVVYLLCLYPFLLHIGSIMLLFELSSIPYNIRMLMIQCARRAIEQAQMPPHAQKCSRL